MECIWCLKPIKGNEITKEHIIPKCVGGKKNSNNIAWACSYCNNERSKLTSYYGNYLQTLKAYKIHGLTSSLKRKIHKYNSKKCQIKLMYNHWVHLEMLRLGFSPTRDIKFVWYIDITLLKDLANVN